MIYFKNLVNVVSKNYRSILVAIHSKNVKKCPVRNVKWTFQPRSPDQEVNLLSALMTLSSMCTIILWKRLKIQARETLSLQVGRF